jgi:hypothetical protein
MGIGPSWDIRQRAATPDGLLDPCGERLDDGRTDGACSPRLVLPTFAVEGGLADER